MNGMRAKPKMRSQGFRLGLLACAFLSSSSYGAITQTMDTEKRLEYPVSSVEINRLSVRGDRITEWVCSDTKMSHEVDETHGHIFYGL